MNFRPSVFETVLSKYIDENELNELIRSFALNIEYDTLKELLKLKYNLILQKKQQPFNFSLQRLLMCEYFFQSNSHTEITQILRHALLIQENNEELMLFENIINVRTTCINNELEVLNIFSLLDVAFTLSEYRGIKMNIYNLKNLAEFYRAICCYYCKQFVPFVIVITKILASKINPYDFLTCLEVVLALDNKEVLCCILEYFLLKNFRPEICLLVFRYQFFDNISSLIGSYETVSQRQGIYLLQQLKSYFLQPFVLGDEHLIRRSLYYLKLPESTIENTEKAWTAFFILSHVAREKQIHLVKPALVFLNDLFSLNPLWIKTVYSILLSHAQHEIVSYTIINLLSSKWFQNEYHFSLLYKDLLESFSKIDYSKATTEAFNNLGEFITTCSDKLFWLTLEDSIAIPWNPINKWLFCKNIFKRNCLKEMKFVIINKHILHLQELPHKYIRSGCIKLCLKFVASRCDASDYTFEDLLQIAKTVNDTDVSLGYFSNIFQNSIRTYNLNFKDRIKLWKNSGFTHFDESQIILQLLKIFDNAEEYFKEYNFDAIPLELTLRIFNSFSSVFENADHVLIFNCLKKAMNSCDKIVLNETIDLIRKLKSNTAFCMQHSKRISQLCSLATNIIRNADTKNYIKNEIALEILKNFSEENYWHILNFEEKFKSIDLLSPVALEIFFKNSSSDSIIKAIEVVYEKGNDKTVATVIQNLPCLLLKITNEDTLCKILQSGMRQILMLSRGDIFKSTLEDYLKIFTSVTSLHNTIPNECYEITQQILELSHKHSFVGHILTTHLKYLAEYCPYEALMYKRIFIECLLNNACIRKEEL